MLIYIYTWLGDDGENNGYGLVNENTGFNEKYYTHRTRTSHALVHWRRTITVQQPAQCCVLIKRNEKRSAGTTATDTKGWYTQFSVNQLRRTIPCVIKMTRNCGQK